ncbi:hypothetical protein IOD13_18975 [Brevibacterium casei]|nr:hypothetical protein [Brevibacterium casei]
MSSPPVEHVADIVANARIFFDRWRIWPMEGGRTPSATSASSPSMPVPDGV